MEDFTTEAFAGILNLELDVMCSYATEVLDLPPDEYSIRTQVKYDLENDTNCIIDMVVESNNTICFIENKINSERGMLDKVYDTLKEVGRQAATYTTIAAMLAAGAVAPTRAYAEGRRGRTTEEEDVTTSEGTGITRGYKFEMPEVNNHYILVIFQ